MEPIKFGTDGVRGKAGEWPVNSSGAYAIGLGIGRYLSQRCSQPKVLVARDTRLSGRELAEALIKGLQESGVDTADAGVMTTPGAAHLTMRYQMSLGAVISASHNPWTENGIKLVGSDGFKLEDADEAVAEGYINNPSEAYPPSQPGKSLSEQDWAGDYIAHLVKPFPGEALRGLKVALDCSNGAASAIAPRAFERLGAQVFTAHAQPNGCNINHECGSEFFRAGKGDLVQNLRATGAHFAVAFDGDADRAIFADEEGNLVDGDHVLYLFARHLLAEGRLPGPAVVTTTMANSGLDDGLSNQGIRTLRTQVGDKYVLREMLAGGFILGGEQSGHIILYDAEHTTGDGIYTALVLANILKAHPQRSLKALVEGFHKKPQVIASARVSARPKLETIPGFTRGYQQVMEQLGAGATVNVRYSGTEPLVRVMIEAGLEHSVEKLAQISLELCRIVQEGSDSPKTHVEVKDCVSGKVLDVPGN